LSAAVNTVTTAVIDGAEEDIKFLHEQTLYTKQMNETLGSAIDLINPVKCMDQMVQQYGKNLGIMYLSSDLKAKHRFL